MSCETLRVPVAWCVELSRLSISISGVVLATRRRHPRPLSLYHSLRSPVGRPLDTSFANNVINYSFAWFRDADNRPVRQTEGRDSRSIRQPMERDSGSTYSWVSIAAAASTPLCTTVEPTSLRVAAAEFYDDHDLHRNPWLSTTCNLCYKVMMRAAWPFVTYRAPHNAVTWPVTQQALLSHADHVAANCNYRPQIKFGDIMCDPRVYFRAREERNISVSLNVQHKPFLARDSIYAIARSLLTPVRLSVCPSVCPAVCHTGGSVKDGYS